MNLILISYEGSRALFGETRRARGSAGKCKNDYLYECRQADETRLESIVNAIQFPKVALESVRLKIRERKFIAEESEARV